MEPGYYGPVPPVGPEPKVWSAGKAVLMLVGVFGAQFLVGIVAFLVLDTFQMLGAAWVETWFDPLLLLSGSLATLGLLLWQRRRLGAMPLVDREELRDWRSWVLAGSVVLFSYAVTVARVLWEPNPEIPDLNQEMLELVTHPEAVPWGPVLVMGLCIVVLAPLTEEWLFRGIVQHILGVRWSFWLSIPFTSLVFGLLHGAQWGVPALYGVALGLLARRQRSLAMPMVAHAGINLSVYLLLVSSGLDMR
jgi:membrane protease YdiL (CAAX protease family)